MTSQLLTRQVLLEATSGLSSVTPILLSAGNGNFFLAQLRIEGLDGASPVFIHLQAGELVGASHEDFGQILSMEQEEPLSIPEEGQEDLPSEEEEKDLSLTSQQSSAPPSESAPEAPLATTSQPEAPAPSPEASPSSPESLLGPDDSDLDLDGDQNPETPDLSAVKLPPEVASASPSPAPTPTPTKGKGK